jgi:Polyketide cyclase / dehydrase and lipid transport
MTVSTCPIATVNAPIERVWPLLSEPSNFDLWWDAHTLSIVPEGHAQPGQTIHARTRGFGKWWVVSALVEAVDDAAHELDLTTSLPLGITVKNHITCTALEGGNTRVSFG